MQGQVQRQVQGQVQGQAPVIQFDLFGPCLYTATVVLSCDKVVGQPGPSGHPSHRTP